MRLDNASTIFGTLYVGGPGIPVVEALVGAGLCRSRREARERVLGGAVSAGAFNPRRQRARCVKITDVNWSIEGMPALLWCGKLARVINQEEA